MPPLHVLQAASGACGIPSLASRRARLAEGARRAGALALLVLPLLCSTCAPASSRSARGLLLITIDTLRADRLGVYGGRVDTPRLDALARSGTWFTAARSAVPLTLPSHATILTGLHPLQHGVRNNGSFRLAPELQTLPEILAARGWRTAAAVGAFILDAQFGLAQGFEAYDDRMPAAIRSAAPAGAVPAQGADRVAARGGAGGGIEGPERDAAAVTAAALALLARRDERPLFLWVHYFDPHAPYTPPEPFHSRHPGTPYDGEVAYVDREVGRLLDALAASPQAARTVVAMVGDHGESLGEHGEQTHGMFLYESALRVPLILAGLGVPARGADPAPASTVDLLPTLLALAGAPAPADLPGTDLLARQARRGSGSPRSLLAETLLPCLSFGWSGTEALVEADLKLIHGVDLELYDLRSDPAEERDLSAQRLIERDRLREILERSRAALLARGGMEGRRVASAAHLPDAETRARLESLGYLAGAAEPPGGCRSGPDPRRMLPVLHLADRGVAEFHAGRYEVAAATFREVIQRDRGNTQGHYYLATTLRTLGRLREAAREFAAAIELDPANLAFRHDEAAAWFSLGDLARAEARLREALELVPDVPKTRYFLGNVLLARGRAAEALAEYDAARAGNPPAAELEFQRARALLALGRRPEATEAVRRACELAPERSEWHGLLAGLLAEQGSSSAAAAVLRDFLARHPEDPLALYNLGVLLEASGDASEALRLYRLSERGWSGDPERLAALRSRIRRLEAAAAPR